MFDFLGILVYAMYILGNTCVTSFSLWLDVFPF